MKNITYKQLYSTFQTILLISLYQLTYGCIYSTQDNSILNKSNPQERKSIDLLKMDFQQGESFSFGFWSQCIPLWNPYVYPLVDQQFRLDLDENGQFLFLIKQTDKNLFLYLVQFDIYSLQVRHIMIINNDQQEKQLTLDYSALDYESKWIFSFITIQPQTQKIIIQVSEKETNKQDLYMSQENLEIFLGGRGYIGNKWNLNIFKGKLSKMYFKPNYFFENENVFFEIINNCKILPISEQEQKIYIIKGYKNFNRDSQIQGSIEQYGQRYCISGWIKFDITQFVKISVQPIFRISAYKNYQSGQKLGDELIKLEVQIDKEVIFMSGYVLIYGLYSIPLMGDYNSPFSLITYTFLYNQNDLYYNGLQEWHFIQYEYGRSNYDEKILFKAQFYNELQLQTQKVGFSPFQGSFTDITFYYFFGGDEFNINMIQAQVFDFKFEYNYKTDKQMMFQACHYSCQTCNGPFKNNCLTCYPHTDRVYLQEYQICQCILGQYDSEEEEQCKKFQDIYPSIKQLEQNIIIDYVCPLGYFLIPQNNQEFTCQRCPEMNQYDLLCLNCLYFQKTWYLKPECTMDLINLIQTQDGAYHFKQRELNQNNLYLIDTSSELNLQLGFQEFCESEEVQNCFETNLTLFNNKVFVKCKQNYYYKNGNCIEINPQCTIATNDGLCQKCVDGMYAKNTDCQPCPTNCQLCQYNKVNQQVECLICEEKYTIVNNQCLHCGTSCQYCIQYFDNNININYLKCLKCIDDSRYFISFDAINCIQNQIQKCQYAFQVNKNNFTLNTLDLYFIPQYQNQDIITLCARCDPGYMFVIKDQMCCKIVLNSMCYFGYAETLLPCDSLFKNLTFTPNQEPICSSEQFCLISYNEAVNVVEFNFMCSNMIQYCNTCLKGQYSQLVQAQFYKCLECEVGYYIDNLTGKCSLCPVDLQCLSCYQQNKYTQDHWKVNIRAFYNVMIENNGQHPFSVYGQSQNKEDYQIICDICPNYYELHNNKCILKCPENCLKCKIINDQNICLQCQQDQQGRLLSISDNQCIQCPPNCSLCRIRSIQEIININPLFSNQIYSKYTHQCLFSYTDHNYYYDSQLGIYLFCQDNLTGCQQQFIIDLNLYCNQDDYSRDLNSNNNYLEQQYFKQKNIFINDLISGNSFKEFENNHFYYFANEKLIKSIVINISSNSEQTCQIYTNSLIQQQFSTNIFTAINVTLKMLFKFKTIFQYETIFKIENFNQIEISGLTIIPQSNIKTKQCIFDGKTPFSLNLYNIVYETLQGIDKSQIIIQNANFININNLIIRNIISNNIEQFISIHQTLFPKTIIINRLLVNNSEFHNQILIYIYQGADDNISLKNSIIQAQFHNSSILNFYKNNVIGSSFIENLTLEIETINCIPLFNLLWIQICKITNLLIQKSDFTNSTIILLNNQAFINELAIKRCSFSSLSIGITNAELVESHQIQFNLNLENLNFQIINYHETAKLIYLKSYSYISSQLSILNINIENNQIQDTSNNFQYYLYNTALLFIQMNFIEIENLIIKRGFGLIEFTFFEAQQLLINKVYITQGDEYNFGLHQYFDCFLQQIQSVYYLQTFFIFSVQNMTLNNIFIEKAITLNSPLIQWKSAELAKIKQQEFVSIQNLIAYQNLFVITQEESIANLISIESQQEINLVFQNLTFNKNILHEFYQSNAKMSSLLLNIDCNQGDLTLENQSITQNIVLNSTDNILSIKLKKLKILNSLFKENSILNYEILKPYLLWGFDWNDSIFFEDLQAIFEINSIAGNGYLIITQLLIQNCIIEDSLGPAFLIVAESQSKLLFERVIFKNISTQFSKEVEQGGGLFIDGSQSLSLNLKFIDLFATKVFSRFQGGLCFIKSGQSNINIEIYNANISDIYSLQGSIIYTSFQNQAQVESILIINKLNIQNTQNILLEYLNQYKKISTTQKFILNNNRTLFFIEFGSLLNLQNIYITNLLFESVMHLGSPQKFSIKSLNIENSIMANYLFFIQSNPFYVCDISFEDIKIESIQLGNYTIINSTCSNDSTTIQSNKNFKCFPQYFNLIVPQSLSYKFPKIDHKCWKNINSQEIITSLQGLILLIDFYETDILNMKNIQFKNINCLICTDGLILYKPQKINYKQISSIYSLYIINSQCGKKGCLILNQESNNNNRILNIYDSKLLYDLDFEFLIKRYICLNNLAQEGTCLNINNIRVYLQDSELFDNSAKNRGGAIYSNSEVLIINTQIRNNQALIGGGAYLMQVAQYSPLKSQIIENIFEDNLISIPQSLRLKMKKDQLLTSINIYNSDNLRVDSVVIQPYYSITGELIQHILLPSGQKLSNYQYFDWQQRQYIPNQQIFRLVALNNYNQIISNLNNTQCIIRSGFHDLSKDQTQINFTDNFTSINQINFNKETLDYNFDEIIIYLDPELPATITLMLEFTCNSIVIPIFNNSYPYKIIGNHSNYKFRVDIKTLPCQLGEMKNLSDYSCQPCDYKQGYFSLKLNQQKCDIKDDISTISTDRIQLNLKQGYWRPFFDSITISECFNKQINCRGGWIEGDSSCYLGHIGAICEECDIYNSRGDGYFSLTKKYTCGSCSETKNNILIIFIVSLWTLISIFISVQSTLKSTKEFVRNFYLTMRGSVILNQYCSGILIKMLTNYLQILGIISTFHLNLPDTLDSTLKTTSSPIESMIYSMDCFLTQIFSFDIHYARMIWEIIMPFIYIQLFFTIFLIGSQLKYMTFNRSVISTTLIYMYIYLQSSIIGGFVLLTSYREISNYKWISANVSQRYDSETHYQWMMKFCSPSLFLLAIGVPLLLFYGLFKNRNSLNNKITRLNWGYLYNEYRKNAYLWEMVNLIKREFIILALIYYEDNILLKASIIIFILIIYQEMNNKIKPYNQFRLNSLDRYLTITCITSINLALVIYLSQKSGQTALNITCQLILLILNIYFISFFLIQIIKEYLRKQIAELQRKVDKLKKVFKRLLPCLLQIHYFQEQLKNHQEKQNRINYLTSKLKQYLIQTAKEIIKLKNEQFKKLREADHLENIINSKPNFQIISSPEKSSVIKDNLISSHSLIYFTQKADQRILIGGQKTKIQTNTAICDKNQSEQI